MNAFVRQLAVLSVLWSFCELLLPEGKQRQMVRLTVSVLVMAALLSGLSGLLGQATVLEWPAQAVLQQGTSNGLAGRIALQAVANQAQGNCVRMAQKAGYEAECVVSLRENGALEKVALSLKMGENEPLMEPEALRTRIVQALGAENEQVQLITLGKPASPAGESGETRP